MIEIALARQIMIDAHDIGRRVCMEKEFEIHLTHAKAPEYLPPRMMPIDHPAQQVECKPAPLVLMLSLIGQGRAGENPSKVLCLHKLRIAADFPDGLH